MRRTLIALAALAVLAAPAAAQDSTAKAAPKAATKPAGPAGTQVVVLETVQGNIVIQLADKDAPKTCANFRKLVASHFYDGTYFHRVITNFMIQGGDPNTKDADPSNDGLGGPGYTVPAEIKLKHVRGAVATARLGDAANPTKASSGSQFFIDVTALPNLDAGGYTVFGHVISGMDVVDKIDAFAKDPTVKAGPSGPNPGKKALIKRAYFAPLSEYEKK